MLPAHLAGASKSRATARLPRVVGAVELVEVVRAAGEGAAFVVVASKQTGLVPVARAGEKQKPEAEFSLLGVAFVLAHGCDV